MTHFSFMCDSLRSVDDAIITDHEMSRQIIPQTVTNWDNSTPPTDVSLSRSQAHAAMMTDWSHAFKYTSRGRDRTAGADGCEHLRYDVGARTASNYPMCSYPYPTRETPTHTRHADTGIPAGTGRPADPLDCI